MATQKGRNWSSGDIVTAANLSSIERGVSEVAEEYTPTTWANGNTVTAAGLNNIEQGIANAGGGNFSLAKMSIVVDGAGASDAAMVQVSNILTSISSSGRQSPFFLYMAPKGSVTIYDNPDPYLNILIGSSATTFNIPENVAAATMQQQLLTISNIVFSGDAEIQTENGYSWVEITGDCTMTITISDSSGGQPAA